MTSFSISPEARIGIAGTATLVLAVMTVGEFSRTAEQTGTGLTTGHELHVAAGTLNVGLVAPGSASSVKVSLENHGALPVRILRIRPGCTCTDVSLESDAVPAGDSACLDVVLNAPDGAGEFGGTVCVEYCPAQEANNAHEIRELCFCVHGMVTDGASDE